MSDGAAPGQIESRRAGLVVPAFLLVAGATPAAAVDCPNSLFTCETDRGGKYAEICATEVVPGEKNGVCTTGSVPKPKR